MFLIFCMVFKYHGTNSTTDNGNSAGAQASRGDVGVPGTPIETSIMAVDMIGRYW